MSKRPDARFEKDAAQSPNGTRPCRLCGLPVKDAAQSPHENLTDAAATWIEADAAGKGAPSSAVLVWDFHEAPEALRALSDDGGDEDTLCLVPPEKITHYGPQRGVYERIVDRLGGACGGPSTFRVPTLLGEFHVLIFAHG